MIQIQEIEANHELLLYMDSMRKAAVTTIYTIVGVGMMYSHFAHPGFRQMKAPCFALNPTIRIHRFPSPCVACNAGASQQKACVCSHVRYFLADRAPQVYSSLLIRF